MAHAAHPRKHFWVVRLGSIDPYRRREHVTRNLAKFKLRLIVKPSVRTMVS